jgi:hypothetical protein
MISGGLEFLVAFVTKSELKTLQKGFILFTVLEDKWKIKLLTFDIFIQETIYLEMFIAYEKNEINIQI